MLTPSPQGSMQKAKKMNYLNRKRGLKNKLHELQTLCDIEAGLILFDPKQTRPETWARNPAELDNIINKYRSLSVEQRSKGTEQNLSDVLKDKKKSLEAELVKLRVKNLDEELSTWEPILDSLSGEELNKVLCSLDSNIEIVKKKLEDEQLMNEFLDQENPSLPRVIPPLNTWPPVQYHDPSGSLQQDQRFEVPENAFRNSDPGYLNPGGYAGDTTIPQDIDVRANAQMHVMPMNAGSDYSYSMGATHNFFSLDQSIDVVDQFHPMNGYGCWAGDTTIPQDNDDVRATAQMPMMVPMKGSDYGYSMGATDPYNDDFWQYDQMANRQFSMTMMNGSDYSYLNGIGVDMGMGGSDLNSLPDRDFGPSNLPLVSDQFPMLNMDSSIYGNPNY